MVHSLGVSMRVNSEKVPSRLVVFPTSHHVSFHMLVNTLLRARHGWRHCMVFRTVSESTAVTETKAPESLVQGSLQRSGTHTGNSHCLWVEECATVGFTHSLSAFFETACLCACSSSSENCVSSRLSSNFLYVPLCGLIVCGACKHVLHSLLSEGKHSSNPCHQRADDTYHPGRSNSDW